MNSGTLPGPVIIEALDHADSKEVEATQSTPMHIHVGTDLTVRPFSPIKHRRSELDADGNAKQRKRARIDSIEGQRSIPELGHILSVIMTTQETDQGFDKTSREIYEEIMRDKNTARQKLFQLAREAITHIPTTDSRSSVRPPDVMVHYNGDSFTLHNISAFGRAPHICDIVSDSKKVDVSRLHCIMILHEDLLYLVDVGSLNGFHIHRLTEDGKETISVAPIQRAVCIPRQETVLVSCSSERFTINPKKCIVCLDSPRSVVFLPCQHFTTCSTCDERLDTCPVCRAEKLDTKRHVDSFFTMT
jgi:hypothetical protein